MNNARIYKRIEQLQNLVSKYAHRWNGGECSNRFLSWDLEYTKIINQHNDIFVKYCLDHNQCPTHDFMDLLA